VPVSGPDAHASVAGSHVPAQQSASYTHEAPPVTHAHTYVGPAGAPVVVMGVPLRTQDPVQQSASCVHAA
jgi:hypothetical protein